MWPAIVAMSPVIVLVGEPVNRYAMRWRWSRWAVRAAPAPLSLPESVILAATSNPLWIALTAPGRWVGDQFNRRMPGSLQARDEGPSAAPATMSDRVGPNLDLRHLLPV